MRHIWIDTDTGVDDAFALLTAVYLERQGLVKIEGVSAVCGNVEQEKTFRNARNVLSLAGREDIPVYPGAKVPLQVPLKTAPHVHGSNGLGGVILEDSFAPKETKMAWDAIYECAVSMNGSLEVILLGPETNLAKALEKYPDLPSCLKRILIMGGAKEGGNSTKDAEFNIYTDPHAAARVFEAGVPIVMCGLDVTMKTSFSGREMRAVEETESAGCALFREGTKTARKIYAELGYEGYYFHDSCPVLYSAFPDMFTGEKAHVTVETKDPARIGKTVVTDPSSSGKAAAIVVTGLDHPRFAKTMKDVITSF